MLLKYFDVLTGRVNLTPAHCYLMLLAVSVNVLPEYEYLMVLYSDNYVILSLTNCSDPSSLS